MAMITHIDRKATEDEIIRAIGQDIASFTQLQEKTGLNKMTLNDYLKRLTHKEIVKTLVDGKIRYRLSKQGNSYYDKNYLKFTIESLLEKEYAYWHDNLSAEYNHTPLINNMGKLQGFSKPEWIKTDGIQVHQLYSSKFNDAFQPIYPDIAELCKDALSKYQERLIEFADKQDSDLPIDNGENKIVIAFEFDLDRIASTLNEIRNSKEARP